MALIMSCLFVEQNKHLKIMFIKHEESENSGKVESDEVTLTLLQQLGAIQDKLNNLEMMPIFLFFNCLIISTSLE
ncbi:hypothetical protein HW45_03120 [Vibrio sp. ER1A]|nr:hypothetical protein HW45_03120 [Vibrio sp. ER1A]